MNSISWNIRGLNDPLKQANVHKLLVNKKVMIAGLLETRMRVPNFDKVWKKMNLQDWSIINNYEHSEIWKIWVVYRNKVKVDLIFKSDKIIHCKIDVGEEEFYWTAIYGANDINKRKKLWQNLISISRIDGPWIIQGDFNAVMSEKDRCGGNSLNLHHLNEMADCMASIGLKEMRSIWSYYTWSNNQVDNNRIWRRIDRALTNVEWQDHYQNSYYGALPNGLSDHSPIYVVMDKAKNNRRSNFRYLNLWAQNPEHNRIIEEEWSKSYQGYTMFKSIKKLNTIKQRFIKLNKKCYTGISQRVITHREHLEKLQKDIQRDPLNSSLLEEERAMVSQLRSLLRSEESFYKQKSRIQWLIV
ncbi:uncharacterized protein LOC126681943 [Mercurialis annua]|uniref:uncharacterized protein LOC126681943 n=1 Tax=Mercurialis annua TaxID=3986 RepID=UPI00215FC0BB|nr:uncharacterized protein LOC126681943 [Mercurialis annua]